MYVPDMDLLKRYLLTESDKHSLMHDLAKINSVLSDGLERFGLTLGIVSHIIEDTYIVHTCVSLDKPIPAGTEFELAETYCTDVVQAQTTLYYKDVAEVSEMLKHPCYLNTQLRAYIGTPILVDGELWGTLNYSSLNPRKVEYTSDEVEFLVEQAILIAPLLKQD